MHKISIYLLLLFLSLLIAHKSYAQSENLSLTTLMGSNQILVIGESYGQSESVDFVSKAATNYISEAKCLKVGLEIPSDQQAVLNRAMRGQVSMSDVEIDNVIDHDSYREMLVNFSEQIIAGKCLSIYAINPPSSTPVTKDAWMEQEVVKIIDDKPIVLLVENKHAVKDFNIPEDSSNKLLAQRLRSRSFGVASVLQHWKSGNCATKNVSFYDTTTDKKSAIYVKESIGEISAAMPEKVSMVSDGVMVWSCESIKVKEVDTEVGNVENRKLIVEVSKYDLVQRDQEVLKKIRGGIKHEYPVVGMNEDEALKALGEPNEIEKSGDFQQWIYQCSDDDGFDYDCYILKFKEGSLVKFDDL
ncbi:MAG: hypothetical protein DHS20C13_23140 [Thermodesulfobacteriota bacterium]|nr:MAG: hypothetical protein DHS20C13_23140 [Thermodesulfobacteriota bacterium]